MSKDRIRKAVRKGYANIVYNERSCCAPVSPCCDSSNRVEDISKRMGYTDADLKSVPKGANLGLGCGNPIALASLREGETVLDLGSGAGLDCFIAAHKVGKSGQVIGVDMTPEMVDKARENARRGSYENVDFRLGEIENIPAADNSVDVVISNCVINLSPDKERVFKEAYRVLKPGGRLMVSDIVLVKELPEVIKNSINAYIGCISGAIMKDEYIKVIHEAGFQDIRILDETQFPLSCMANDPTAQVLINNNKLNLPQDKLTDIDTSVLSIKVTAKKPG